MLTGLRMFFTSFIASEDHVEHKGHNINESLSHEAGGVDRLEHTVTLKSGTYIYSKYLKRAKDNDVYGLIYMRFKPQAPIIQNDVRKIIESFNIE